MREADPLEDQHGRKGTSGNMGKKWHKKCSGIPGPLKSDASFKCKWSTGQARPIDGRLMAELTVGWEKLDVVPFFYYLRDCLSSGGGCEIATITKCHVAWDKINKLLPILTSCLFSITSRGRIFNLSMWSAMLHASETWALSLSELHCLHCFDRAMIHWMCVVTVQDQISLHGISVKIW